MSKPDKFQEFLLNASNTSTTPPRQQPPHQSSIASSTARVVISTVNWFISQTFRFPSDLSLTRKLKSEDNNATWNASPHPKNWFQLVSILCTHVTRLRSTTMSLRICKTDTNVIYRGLKVSQVSNISSFLIFDKSSQQSFVAEVLFIHDQEILPNFNSLSLFFIILI